jgi:hypothetical protein
MRGGSKGEGERTGMRGRIVEGREEKRLGREKECEGEGMKERRERRKSLKRDKVKGVAGRRLR